MLFITIAVAASPFLAALIGVYSVRAFNVRQSATKYQFYKVTFPRQFTLEQQLDWYATVSGTFANSSILSPNEETIVLEIRSDKNGIIHRIGIPWQHTQLINDLRAHIEGIHIVEHKLEEYPAWTHAVEVGMSDNNRLLDVNRIEAQSKRILSAVRSDLRGDDAVVVQLVLNSVGKRRQLNLSKPVTSSSTINGVLRGLKADKNEISERMAKLAEHQFRMVLRVAAYAPNQDGEDSKTRAVKLVNNVRNAYRSLNSSGTHLTPRRARLSEISKRLNAGAGLPIYPARINATELAAFAGWPLGSPPIAGLTLGMTRYLPPNEIIEKNGRRLGLSYQDRPIAITAEDACRHMYIIAPSGFGKTTLLANSLQQDIERGYGAVVIDNKGDLFQAALNSVPRERLDDVIVMDLTDDQYPVGLNLLHEGDPRFVVDNLLRILTHGSNDTLYLRRWASNAIQTLRHSPDATLADVLPFLNPQTPQEKAWRASKIDELPKNSQLRAQWSTWNALSDSERNQRIAPVENRFWSMTYSNHLARILGQGKSTIDVRSVLTDNKLLFIYIPDALGESTVKLLGGLLFSVLWDAVQTVEKDKPTYLYLDEVQKVLDLPIDIPDMLSRSRSFKFGLNMAHQYRTQLSPELQSAIANASTTIAFKLSGEDANWMQKIMGKAVSAEDFTSLGAYEAIGRIAVNGGSSGPTYFKTLPRFKEHGLAEEVRRRSRARYARQADAVDREILKRRTGPTKASRPKPSFGYAEE